MVYSILYALGIIMVGTVLSGHPWTNTKHVVISASGTTCSEEEVALSCD